MTVKIKEELIFQNLDFENSKEVLHYLANKLHKKNLVNDEFAEELVKREKSYPTGLPAKINVAIPHTDSDYVKEAAIAVGVLNSPVVFNSMEDPNVKLEVRLVIMLAIKDSSKQIQLLQNIIALIQSEDDISEIINSSDKTKTKNIMNKYI